MTIEPAHAVFRKLMLGEALSSSESALLSKYFHDALGSVTNKDFNEIIRLGREARTAEAQRRKNRKAAEQRRESDPRPIDLSALPQAQQEQHDRLIDAFDKIFKPRRP